jgi:predicted RNA-binding protein associated with RNAse of E/G family
MSDKLAVASTAVYREVFNDRVCYARAVRVLDSDGSSATTARWPGAAIREITQYLESLRTGSKALREQARVAHTAGDWELADGVWQRTGVVEQVASGRWFSVSRMHDADGALVCWYVNFERPPLWRRDGWDTHDLALDLVVAPDRSWRWKDLDEYDQGRKLGLISDAEHKAVQAARSQAVALVKERSGLFAADPGELWLPDPAWPLPTLP